MVFFFFFSLFKLRAPRASAEKAFFVGGFFGWVGVGGACVQVLSRQNTREPIGKMRNKESETLYPVSTALCVSQRPGPIIHSPPPTPLPFSA